MKVADVFACVLVLLSIFDVLGVDAEEPRKNDAYYDNGIPNKYLTESMLSRSISLNVPIAFKKFRRQVNGDKNSTLSERKNQKIQRRHHCIPRTNCYNRPRNSSKNHLNLDNRSPNINKNKRRNMQLRDGFNKRKRKNNRNYNKSKKNFKSPRLKTKSLSQVFRSRHGDNDFRHLDNVSRNMYINSYRPDKRLEDRVKNTEFFNIMQTFFDKENAYNRRFLYGRRKPSKGTWLSGGFDIDSTMELVSTKSAANTYRDYDDEYQKSISSVYKDYHNPLRHSLVNLLTELFVTLNNSTLDNDYEMVSGLANENVEISESANDFCQRWIDHKDKLEAVFLGSSRLPSCPCFYPSNIFYNDKIWDKKQQKNFRWRDASGKSQRMDVYKPGAFYCVRSLLTQGIGSAAAQHCCYDRERRLITRGSGSGTPNFVSPEASQVLHEKIDLLPWQLCKGDFSRFNSMRPPNNDNNCKMNPDEEEYQRQKAERKSF